MLKLATLFVRYMADALPEHASLSYAERTYQLDVTDRAQYASVADQVEADLGPVHLVCNNAGVYRGGAMDSVTFEDWDWVMGVNVGGVINGVQTWIQRIKGHGQGGHIVNTASVGGLISGPPEGLYTTTKFAVVGLSEALLLEVADKGVGVSVLCPGLVDTNLITQSFAVRPQSLNPGIDHQQPAPDVASGISPLTVGEQVIDAVREGGFYVITHDDYREIIQMRHDGILDALDAHAARYGSTSGRTTAPQ